MKYEVRGFNPLKPLRRFVGERLSPKGGGNGYEVINKEKERLSHNRKHLRQALAYVNGGSLPAGFEKEPDAVKFGYYMDRGIFDFIVSSGADDLKGIEKSEGIGRQAHARKALNNFFRLLRGEAFDLPWAVHGAVMILQYDLDTKGKVLPKELQNLASNLWSAGDRIGVEIDAPLSAWGAVIGTVATERRRETGDVRVIPRNNGTFTFRTKEISTNRTRFGVFPKRTAGVDAIRVKLSAAYQSIYHVASEVKNTESEKPNFLNMTPLYGSDEDGSDIARVAVPGALKEAVRATTFDPKLRIKFTGGTDSHYAFRQELAKELARIFPHRDLRREVKDSATTARKKIIASHIEFDKGGSDSTNSRSDSGSDDGAQPFANETEAVKRPVVKLGKNANEPTRGIGDTPSPSSSDSEEEEIESRSTLTESSYSIFNKPASGSKATGAITGPSVDGFNGKRARNVKSEGGRSAKSKVKTVPPQTSDVVFTSAFSVNGQRQLQPQEIRDQIKAVVDPLRHLYLTGSERRGIPGHQLHEHIQAFDRSVKDILLEISNAQIPSFEDEDNRRIEAMENQLRKGGEILVVAKKTLDMATSEDQRNDVEEVLRKFVKAMDVISKPPKTKAAAKGRVPQRPEQNVVSEATSKEIYLNLPADEVIVLNVSRAAFLVCRGWERSEYVGKKELLDGLEEVINISTGARSRPGLVELKKNHNELMKMYSAIKEMKDEYELVQLHRMAMSVLRSMQRRSTVNQ